MVRRIDHELLEHSWHSASLPQKQCAGRFFRGDAAHLHLQNSVDVVSKPHIHAFLPGFGRRHRNRQLAELQVLIAVHSLALVDLDLHQLLPFAHRAETLHPADGQGAVALDDGGHQIPRRVGPVDDVGAQGKGADVRQDHIPQVCLPGLHGRVHSCTQGHHRVRLRVLLGPLAQKMSQILAHQRHFAASAHRDHPGKLTPAKAAVPQGAGHGGAHPLQQLLAVLHQLFAGEGQRPFHPRAVHDHNSHRVFGEGLLALLCLLQQNGFCRPIKPAVIQAVFHAEKMGDHLVKVISAQGIVAAHRQNVHHVVKAFHHGNIQRAAAKVKH